MRNAKGRWVRTRELKNNGSVKATVFYEVLTSRGRGLSHSTRPDRFPG